MPDSFTSCSGRMDRPQQASMIDAVTESWPQPAHKVDMLPSYWRRVSPNVLVGSDGCATLGLLMYDMLRLDFLARDCRQPRRLSELRADAVDDGLGRHGEATVAQYREKLRFLHRSLQR